MDIIVIRTADEAERSDRSHDEKKKKKTLNNNLE